MISPYSLTNSSYLLPAPLEVQWNLPNWTPVYIEHLHTLNNFSFPMSVQCRQVPLYLCILGHYMFIETNTRQGRLTILRSPEVKVTQKQCLKFHYMGHGVSGAHGRLQLFRNFHPYQKRLVWNATAHTVRKWISVMLDLPAGSYNLTFEGRRSATEASSYSNSIAFAIDDVELMPGGCTEQCKYHYRWTHIWLVSKI